jgi:multicomponent Na+:H+ antiporter subunit F
MTGAIPTIGDVLLALIALAMLPVFLRLLRGPSLTDRVVALDLITTISVAMSALYATIHDAPVFLDVAILVALISFVATIAFARYVERRRVDRNDR